MSETIEPVARAILAAQLANEDASTKPHGWEDAHESDRRVAILLARAAIAVKTLGTPTRTEIYEALKHGDEEHQAWLREAIAAVFDGDPIPAPRGVTPYPDASREAARILGKCPMAHVDACPISEVARALTKARSQ